VAITTPRRRSKDPEGRMPLREHLRELRRRLLRAALAVVAGAAIGWFLYEPLFDALQHPLAEASARGHHAEINFNKIGGAFNFKILVTLYVGIVLASPVWLYQLWAFIVPGLTRREKRYALGFVGVAVPLFLSGLALAWLVLPNAVRFLTDFTPKSAVNYVNADEYLTFVTKIMGAFGVAFLVPVLLVALNMVGVLTAAGMLRSWRVAVFLCFLFAAVASPSPDAWSMIALATPMVVLFFAAVGVAWFIDRRRARRDPFAGLADDEASSLDDEAGSLDDEAGTLDEDDSPSADSADSAYRDGPGTAG
jgi:sec-independent protein translocase protein TatC